MTRLKTPRLLMSSMLLSLPAAAITIDDSSSAQNDRFANDASFILNDYDLSGVGISNEADPTWATLLSRNVFVSANHFSPADGSTLTFYQTNDPLGPSISRTVTGGQRIGDTDIYLGLLDSAVPVGYATYDFATQDINSQADFDNSVLHDTNAFVVGRSTTGNFSGDQNLAVGRNEIDRWVGNVSVEGSTGAALLADQDDEANDVPFEANLFFGDSGAPLLVDLDESDDDFSLTIVGTNWFIGSISDPQVGVNGFTYLGNHDATIQSFIDANPVPEPSSIALLAIAGAAMARRRRR